jgi:hypothetical protein
MKVHRVNGDHQCTVHILCIQQMQKKGWEWGSILLFISNQTTFISLSFK